MAESGDWGHDPFHGGPGYPDAAKKDDGGPA